MLFIELLRYIGLHLIRDFLQESMTIDDTSPKAFHSHILLGLFVLFNHIKWLVSISPLFEPSEPYDRYCQNVSFGSKYFQKSTRQVTGISRCETVLRNSPQYFKERRKKKNAFHAVVVSN